MKGIKDSIKGLHDDVTVPFLHFEYVEITNKKQKNKEIQKHLKTKQIQANISYLVNFIEKFLAKFIHHRNMLLHYRSSIKQFNNLFESIGTDIDISENLILPVKHQSLHLSYTNVTVHSGIIEVYGEKIYHVHLSKNHWHDRTFVKIVLHMLNNVNLTNKTIIIGSNNCSSQYKSLKHF